MDQVETRGQERILVLDSDPENLARSISLLSKEIPGSNVRGFDSRKELNRAAEKNLSDIVVLDYSFVKEGVPELIHELRLQDHEPAVLVVSDCSDPRIVADAYNAGCDKVIVKNESWENELCPAVRHALRIRRLEDENRRLIARLVEANQLLEEKNKRLDDFSAMVAHDIRGPLGGLSMKIEYILDTYKGKIDTRMTELLQRASRSTERLTGIVQAMYDFARIGAKAANMTRVDLAKLVEEVISDLEFKDSLDIQIGIGELPVVWGNESLLRRVFINLISNGVKYNDSKQISINIGSDGFYESSLAKFARVFIEDNGRGIPRDELPSLFAKFTRGSSSLGESEGIGLGLAVVSRIIDLHCGKIEVSSEVGHGSKFCLILPLEKIELAG